MTACIATDVRIMPGMWLRLRGGRKAKRNTVGGTVMQMHSFRDPNFPGSNSHMAQIKTAGAVAWNWFDLATYTLDPFTSGAISLAYDNSYSLTNAAAIANVTDRPVFYNGLGRRDGTDSRPALTSYYAGIVRYFGLDAYSPTGAFPTVAFAAGAGNNEVAVKVTIWVGLHHVPTGHYSNAVLAGTITTTGASGTITVSNLSRLPHAYNNATEQGELKYVFYATIDGYKVPYLIMNSAHTGPETAAQGSASKSLSIETAVTGDTLGEDTRNGWFLDTTSEAPTVNFPPKPMKCLCAVNQRLYGIPLQGGSGSGPDFAYTWNSRDLASVVWSKAAGDDRDTKTVGDPNQCWPLENKKITPNIETPIWLSASISGDAVLVWTPKRLILMSQLTNGLHVFNDISTLHGIKLGMTVRDTEYGKVWVDQRNAICLLKEDSKSGLVVLSEKYQDLLRGKTVTCADYILDPENEIDHYKVWLSDGTFVVHDFKLRDADFPEGMAYTGTNSDFTAAATLVQQDGTRHYVVAKGGFYTHEVEPTTGLIPTTDQTFVNTTDQTITTAEVNGEFRFNWDRITDWKGRKSLAEVAIIGDGATSVALATYPIKMKWWGDFQEVPGAVTALSPTQNQQTRTAWSYNFRPTQSNKFFFKFGFTMAGHSADDTDFLNHRRPAVEGDLDKNFYGSICEAAALIGNEGNRG